MPETVVHFQIRMPPVLHEQLASWAKEDKASLNALIVGILEKAIEQHEAKTATQGMTDRACAARWLLPPPPDARRLDRRVIRRALGSIPTLVRESARELPLSAPLALVYPRRTRFPDSSIGRASGC